MLADASGGPLATRLDELGWADVVADDEATAVRTLFEVKGETLSPADALGPRIAEVLTRTIGEPELADAVVVLPKSLHPDQLPVLAPDGEVVVLGVVCSAPSASGTTLVVPAR